jgi:hypothetical protein
VRDFKARALNDKLMPDQRKLMLTAIAFAPGREAAGAMLELARVYGYGEEKYARYNYLKGYPWSLSVDALFRHLLAFLAGEDRDPESGLLHTAHAAWHALTLTAYIQREIGTDDRFKVEPKKVQPNPASTTTYADLLKQSGSRPHLGWCCAAPNAAPHEGPCRWCCYDALGGRYDGS